MWRPWNSSSLSDEIPKIAYPSTAAAAVAIIRWRFPTRPPSLGCWGGGFIVVPSPIVSFYLQDRYCSSWGSLNTISLHERNPSRWCFALWRGVALFHILRDACMTRPLCLLLNVNRSSYNTFNCSSLWLHSILIFQLTLLLVISSSSDMDCRCPRWHWPSIWPSARRPSNIQIAKIPLKQERQSNEISRITRCLFRPSRVIPRKMSSKVEAKWYSASSTAWLRETYSCCFNWFA